MQIWMRAYEKSTPVRVRVRGLMQASMEEEEFYWNLPRQRWPTQQAKRDQNEA